MNYSYDLFVLMAKLSQLRDGKSVIKTYIQKINELFSPVTFNYTKNPSGLYSSSFAVKTAKSNFGYLETKQGLTADNESKELLTMANHLLALILENISFTQKTKSESGAFENLAGTPNDPEKTIKHLEKARLASFNLIEDLSEEIEKRKAAELTLRKSEEKYRMLFENNQDGVFICSLNDDMSFTILETNKAIEAMLGKPNKGTTRVNPLDFEVNGSEEKLHARVWELMQKGEIEFIARLKHKEGHFVDAHIKALVIQYDNHAAFYNIVRDITIQKQDEDLKKARLKIMEEGERKTLPEVLKETLAEAEILTQSKIGFYHFIDEDAGFVQLGQWSENTMEEGCTIAGSYPFNYPIEKAGVWTDCIKTRNPVIHNDYTSLTHKKGIPDGHIKIVRQLVAPVIRDNKIFAILGIGNKETDYTQNDIKIITQLADLTWDIAERKISQQKLRDSEEKYRLIFERSPLGVLHFDKQAIITECNDHFVTIIGSSKKALVGLNMLNLPDKNIVDRLKLVLNGKTASYEGVYKSVTANKTTPIRLLFSPILDKKGNVEGGIGLVEDRTSHAQSEEFRKQVEVVKESARFKQNFLANMSHEIRTPLTGVLGMIDILEETSLSDKQKEYISVLKNSGENLREIINQVLDFSKIEAGKVTLKRNLFEFNEIAETARKLFGSSCKNNVSFEMEIDESIPRYVKADQNRISQIVNNLVSNAVKFTNEGYIRLSAQLLSRIPDKKQIVIKVEVTDSGIGIPDYLQEKLFAPFAQIDENDTRLFEGTGLGLSICKELASMHGGEIGVKSEYKKGSTFWFTFLAGITEDIPDKTKMAPEVIPAKKLNILFAEDKLINQKVVSLLLSSLGHQVKIARNGKEVLDIFKPGKYDLILMDIQMPVMDGITATKELKQKYSMLPPVVGLSANAFEGDREKYMDNGMDDYLTKPLRREDFIEMTQRIFGRNEHLRE